MKACGYIIGLSMLIPALLLSACNLSNVVVSKNDFPDTMMRVQHELNDKGYKVIRIQALDQGLKKAGYQIENYRIIFFGNSLDFDIVQERYPELTVFLPLSVSVYEDNGLVYIQSMPFSMAKKATRDKEYLSMVERWRKDVDEAIGVAAYPLP